MDDGQQFGGTRSPRFILRDESVTIGLLITLHGIMLNRPGPFEIIAAGVFLIIYTERYREFSKKMFPTDKLKAWAVVPLFFGVVLVVGAFFEKEVFGLALILGLIALLKGGYLIVGPTDQVKKLLDWWFDKATDRTIRLSGLIIFFLGTAIFTAL